MKGMYELINMVPVKVLAVVWKKSLLKSPLVPELKNIPKRGYSERSAFTNIIIKPVLMK